MTALLDTGFLIAVISVEDKYHLACRQILSTISNPLLPTVVLPELAYMLIRSSKNRELVQFFREVQNNPSQLVSLTAKDLERATDILEKYNDAKLDFVDCAIMAIAERLKIERILTIDQRDFRMFRPHHVLAFTILP